MSLRNKKPSLSVTQALGWLGHSPQGAQLLSTVRQLQAAQAALQAALPAALARQVKVCSINGQELSVLVPSPACAARLRQMTAVMASSMNNAGWPTKRIVIRIDASVGHERTIKPHRIAQAPDARALAAFDDLHAQLAPGPLADAVSRLLIRHRKL